MFKDVIRFLFVCINKKSEQTSFVESLIDNDDSDEWLNKAKTTFSYSTEDIDAFKSWKSIQNEKIPHRTTSDKDTTPHPADDDEASSTSTTSITQYLT